MYKSLTSLISDILKSAGATTFIVISLIHIAAEVGTVYLIGTGMSSILVTGVNTQLIVIIIFCLVGSSFASLLFQTTLTYFSAKFGNELSQKYIEACVKLNKDVFELKGQPYLIKNSIAEMIRVSEWVVTPFALGAVKFLIALGIIIVLASEDINTTLIICCGLSLVYTLIYVVCSPINKNLGQKLTSYLDQRSIVGNDILSTRHLINADFLKASINNLSDILSKEAGTRALGTLIAFLPKNVLETISLLLLIFVTVTITDQDQRMQTLMLYGFAGYKLLPAFQAVYYGISRTIFNLGVYETVKNEISAVPQNIASITPFAGEYKFAGCELIRDNETISFEGFVLGAGELTLLSGQSGSGKSSLMEVMIGYEHRYSSTNKIPHINTILIPQNLPALSFKIDDFLAPKDWTKYAFLEGIEYQSGKRLSDFSGGQLQRIFLAYAINVKSKYIFLDESLSGISSDLEYLALKHLRDYVRETGSIALVTTHRRTNLDMYDKEISI